MPVGGICQECSNGLFPIGWPFPCFLSGKPEESREVIFVSVSWRNKIMQSHRVFKTVFLTVLFGGHIIGGILWTQGNYHQYLLGGAIVYATILFCSLWLLYVTILDPQFILELYRRPKGNRAVTSLERFYCYMLCALMILVAAFLLWTSLRPMLYDVIGIAPWE